MSIAAFDPIPALIGGALIGLSAGLLRLGSGHIAGISGILRLGVRGPDRSWQLTFLAGILIAGAFAAVYRGPGLTAGLERASLPMLAIAGLLVGLGTGISNGCTSGHGICGLARFSKRSLAAVMTFMTAAAVVVYVRGVEGWL